MSRPIRRSQALAPFGIGSMVDFPGPLSLIHAGLDAWPFDDKNPDHREFKVEDEPRLANRLGVDFFVQPPDFRKTEFGSDEKTVNLGLRLPFLRFPIWHSCPRCGRMFESKFHMRTSPECDGPIMTGSDRGKPHKKRRTIQVRFVSACTEGHLRDFPWIEWLSLDREEWSGIRHDRWLRLHSTGSATIAGVVVVAEKRESTGIVEVARKSLATAFSVDPKGATIFTQMGLMCDGQNPALGIGHGGSDPQEKCGKDIRTILRGASNLYFSDIRSSIYVPEIRDLSFSQEILDLIDDFSLKQELLTSALSSDTGLVSPKAAGVILRRNYPESKVDIKLFTEAVNKHVLHELLTNNRFIAAWLVQKSKLAEDKKISNEVLKKIITEKYPEWEIPPSQLIEQINLWLSKRENSDLDEITNLSNDSFEDIYRSEEYLAFSRDGQDGFPKANLLIRSEDISSYDLLIQNNFSRVALLDKLRETRAFVGFSRIFDSSNVSNPSRWKLISHEKKNWLPAIVVRGEGIFLVFNKDRLSDWVKAHGEYHVQRFSSINKNLKAQAERRKSTFNPSTPTFTLLHTFAHVLISQLIFDCGYGSSSLRERIYYSEDDLKMAGVLIYTAAGDSEGTMGGLVKMGEPGFLDQTIGRALERARWCSSDPVCIDSSGQGPDNCNLAACHSCALLPETSCEQQNRLLDRGVLVGDLNRHDSGFFSSAWVD
jgi:hypothetical protein